MKPLINYQHLPSLRFEKRKGPGRDQNRSQGNFVMTNLLLLGDDALFQRFPDYCHSDAVHHLAVKGLLFHMSVLLPRD